MDGRPFNRSKRSIVYQRSKSALDKRPFGRVQDVYADNYEWINHSLALVASEASDAFHVRVGGPSPVA